METWHKQRMYGAADTVLWAILREDGSVVGSALLEADADAIIRDHKLAALAGEYIEMLRRLPPGEIRGGEAFLVRQWDAIASGSAEEQS